MSIEVMPLAAPRLPRHVGIIMDGNGRWAQQHGLPRVEGHRVGAQSVKDIVRAARQLGIKALTLYAFSAQNWARPAEEVGALMQLLHDYLVEERPEIMANGIHLQAIGDIARLPSAVRTTLDALMADSASSNPPMRLTLALSYGGRESIAKAARKAVQAVLAGELRAEDLDAEQLDRFLPTHDLPPLDLLIRTSGEQRISNFMLWELAYAELMFTDTLWPDFRRQSLYELLELYAHRERRFGLTGQQIAALESDVEPNRSSALLAPRSGQSRLTSHGSHHHSNEE